jgi:hypothetical protein
VRRPTGEIGHAIFEQQGRIAMKIHVTIEANPLAWGRLRRLFIVGVGVLSIAIPAAVWASHDFSDVPTEHQFHSQISAIAGAGITTGCAPGLYCPADPVRRDQMAAFMHRGFSRLGWFPINATVTQTSNGPAAALASATFTVGLPDNALAGSGAFIEGHVAINLVAPSSGCPCEYRASLIDVTDPEPFALFDPRLIVNNSEVRQFTVTGATDTGVPGEHTIELRVWRVAGTGTGATAQGDATLSYHPFGSAGTNSFGTSAESHNK